MTRAEALAWIDSLESLGIQPGLERITALLERLGNPERDLPSVIVAGTNGKGSVTAFLASILSAAGVEAGVYTSPHLRTFEERIRVGAQPIGPEELAALTGEVADAVEAMRRERLPSPTYFEATTAMAFLHFRRRRVPIAVLEVGMGGRFDATNVATPLASAITPVSLDHTQYLGSTVEEIAWQKAGIVKPGVTTIVGAQEPAAHRVIADEAAHLGSPLIETVSCRFEPAGLFPDPPAFVLTTPAGARYDARLSLRGDHQADNAATAVLLTEILAKRGVVPITAAHVARGLAEARWPGRLDLERRHGPHGPFELLLDGAHNPAGCRILADYLRRHQSRRPRRVLLFAAMRDKPAPEMLRELGPVVDEVITTEIGIARGTPADELGAAASAAGLKATVITDRDEALRTAATRAGSSGLVVACGSLYLVGALLG
ncbi:MAG TPA: folylpolyglutamate synthase/dihydrofolate synthase family protein [Candidatus Polarisedimenticolia bacterium]|jgi:dihydrofolate synthase/folylpolyglutamate synthase|nr:folylpolyglutamate synthase/dihydrofolate synthase family protein [Candidatus Polarisedimenticolia bacterium]